MKQLVCEPLRLFRDLKFEHIKVWIKIRRTGATGVFLVKICWAADSTQSGASDNTADQSRLLFLVRQ